MFSLYCLIAAKIHAKMAENPQVKNDFLLLFFAACLIDVKHLIS